MISNWDPRLRSVLGGFSWAGLLDPILISEEFGVEKPHVTLFRRAEERAGLKAEECALVGDDPLSDRAGAEGAGWRYALVDRPHRGLWEALGELGL